MNKCHAVLIVDSEQRNMGTSYSGTNFIYQFTHPITFHKKSQDKQYFVRAENIDIPISFYAITQYNNTFTFDESAGGSDITITVPSGNYTIDELLSEIQTMMNAGGTNTYTLTYDDITQKVNIASDGVGGNFSFDLTFAYTLLGPLGFDGTETITGASNVDASNVAHTNTTRYLKLIIDNVASSNVYDARGKQNVMFKIPITQTRNEYQFYENRDGYMVKISPMSSINEISVKLIDPDNHVVSFNGVPWSFDLVFYEWNRNGLQKLEQDISRY